MGRTKTSSSLLAPEFSGLIIYLNGKEILVYYRQIMAQLKRKFRENRALLPPLSFATILGMALFTVYIGSAVLSALPFHLQSSYDGVGALYTAAEEAAYCAANFPEADTCFAPSTTTNRTIYMQPYVLTLFLVFQMIHCAQNGKNQWSHFV